MPRTVCAVTIYLAAPRDSRLHPPAEDGSVIETFRTTLAFTCRKIRRRWFGCGLVMVDVRTLRIYDRSPQDPRGRREVIREGDIELHNVSAAFRRVPVPEWWGL